MTIENISAVTSSSGLVGDSIAKEEALPQLKTFETLPAIEFKTGLKTGFHELQKAVDAANEIFNQVRPDIKFVIDESTKDVVVVLLEPETGDVINRYPTEQAMAISNAIVESQARIAERQEAFQSTNKQLLGLFVQQET